MTDQKRLQWALLALRVGISTVFLAWTIDKIVNFEHNSGMIQGYYGVAVSQWFLMGLGIAELVLVLAFLAGLYKTATYGVILFAHTVTTLVSFHRLLPPYEIHQLLYFGSLPMLGACIALFLLRHSDTLMTVRKK